MSGSAARTDTRGDVSRPRSAQRYFEVSERTQSTTLSWISLAQAGCGQFQPMMMPIANIRSAEIIAGFRDVWKIAVRRAGVRVVRRDPSRSAAGHPVLRAQLFHIDPG